MADEKPTLLKTLRGVGIYVNSLGRFSAEIGGTEVKRSKLSELEKLIERQSTPVQAIKLNGCVSKPLIVEIVGVEKDGRFRGRHRELFDTWKGSLYRYDEERLAELEDIYDRFLKLDEEWGTVIAHLNRLSERDLQPEPSHA